MRSLLTRGFVTIIVTAASAVIAILVAGLFRHPLVFPPVFVLLFGAFVLQGIRRIPADPPYRAIMTVLGQRIKVALNEGWQFLPFFPFVFGMVLVKIEKVNVDLPDQKVRTPEMAELVVPVSYTFQPDYHSPEGLITYEDSGGDTGVINILNDVTEQELRQWSVAYEVEEGVLGTWEDVARSGNEAVERLIRAVCDIGGRTGISDDQVAQVRAGNGLIRIPTLGIILNRLNIGEIEPTGDLAKAAEQAAREDRDRQAEEVELAHIRRQAGKIKRLGYSPEQALELIQTERGKVVKTVSESKISVSQEVRGMLEGIAGSLTGLLGGKDEEAGDDE